MNKIISKSGIVRDASAVILFGIAIIIGISIYSFTPHDPSALTYAQNSGHVKNLTGRFGANIAGIFIFLIGIGSFIIPLALIQSIWFIVIKPDVDRFIQSITGYLALIFTVCIFFTVACPQIYLRDGMVTTGGILGISLGGFLFKYLYIWGTAVFITVLTLTGFILITGQNLKRIINSFKGLFLFFFNILKKLSFKKRTQKENTVKNENTGPKIIESKEDDLPIKISPLKGKNKSRQSDDIFNVALRPVKGFQRPDPDLLDRFETKRLPVNRELLLNNARLLEEKLENFGVIGKVTEVKPGPVITMYEYSPAPGVKISKISGLADDLALALKAISIRIIAPLPGKAVIGIEIPNEKREMVYLHEIINSKIFRDNKSPLTVSLGKDVVGQPVITELNKLPHMLIAGATGTGKSVGLNAIILSILFKATPDEVRMLLIDPKRIELSTYEGIPHLLHPVVVDPKKATSALKWAVIEMERRYKLLAKLKARNIEGYNKAVLKMDNAGNNGQDEENEEIFEPIPYIIIIIDELADLMMVSSKEVEDSIMRLSQMARAAGIHLILATQRPSVDVITGVIKANVPARISFQVSSKIDSRTILDTMGAEKLLGAGDMLFLPPGTSFLQRIHGAFVSDEEIERVTDFLKKQRPPEYDESITKIPEKDEVDIKLDDDYDEKYNEAVELVCNTGQASISMVQRRLRVGYNRAARMIEIMERDGIVGPSDGSKPRAILAGKL